MFLMFMWICVCLAGGVVAGNVQFVQTTLTAAIDEDDATITVKSTEGLPSTGIVVIENEHVGYSGKTSTTLYGSLASPVVRGAQGTEATEHATGVAVTTVPGSLLNSSAEYNIATLADAAGIQAFVTVPLALFRLVGEFFFLPLGFLGTNLAIISYLWMVIAVGMIVALAVSMAGGRRV